ncbi:hypothetical protein [Paraburkholderia fungorum]|uniref:hypothetical protein n=1 Tax=Paraburkholderia fungorum TaxID=134537 RepID=UPI00387795E4
MERLNSRSLLAVAFIAGGCLGWLVRFPPIDSSSAAGWAQAFGTVGAIFGSFAISRYQIKKEVVREKIASLDRRTSMLEIVLALTSDMVVSIQRLPALIDRDTLAVDDLDELELQRAKFAKSAQRLQIVPLFEISSSEAAFAVCDLERVASELLSRIESLHRHNLQSSFFAETKFSELAESVRDAREQIKEALSGLHRDRDCIEQRTKESN